MSDDDEYGEFPDVDLSSIIEATESSIQSCTSRKAIPSERCQQLVSTQIQAKAPVQQPVPQKLGRASGSAVIVSLRQKGNPILSSIKNLPWEYGEIAPDYLLGVQSCALFLSLKYHKLHPDYIYTRIRNLGQSFTLRIMLVLVDITEHSGPLRELTKGCLLNNFTLILAWSTAEAGRYLETFKSYEHATPMAIMERPKIGWSMQVEEFMTQVRSVNKTDAMSLVSNFGSVASAVMSRKEEVELIPGWGKTKVGRFEKAVSEGFRVGARARTKGSMKMNSEVEDGKGVSERLGLGERSSGGAKRNDTKRTDCDADAADEDALAAIVEAEEREKTKGDTLSMETLRAQNPTKIPDDVNVGIMAALEKMRNS